jgi:hypothetical protein
MQLMKTPRSAMYLAFVRSQLCAVTQTDHGVVAHHVRMPPHGGGVGLKPSDYRTVPLNQMRHLELHQVGEKTFWKRAGVVPEMVMAELLHLWIMKRYGIELPMIEDPDQACAYVDALERFIVSSGAA